MATEDQDKSEEPTAYRLEEAKKKGEVSKSAEVTGVAVLILFAITAAMTASWVTQAIVNTTVKTIAYSGSRPVIGNDMLAWLSATYYPVLQSLFPLVLVLIIVSVVGNVFQTGPIFTTHPITPDFQRLNPTQAFKRIFSIKSVLETGKLILKMTFLALLLYIAYRNLHEFVANVANNESIKLPFLMKAAFIKVSIYILAVLVVMALIDYLLVHREFMKKMRMSRRDLRDEVKKKDGDPEVKSKQKQLIRDVLKKARSVAKVAEADVVLVNPTHVAVALKFSPKTMRAPIVLSKGAGYMGGQIRKMANKHQIPIVHMPALARLIYKDCAIDAPVAEKLYSKLAVVYRWLYSQKKAVQL